MRRTTPSSLSAAAAQSRVEPHHRRLYERGRRLDAYLSGSADEDSAASVDSTEKAGLLESHRFARAGASPMRRRLKRAALLVVVLAAVLLVSRHVELGLLITGVAPCAGAVGGVLDGRACSTVYHARLEGWPPRCYRIPTIIRTHAGTLLAFAERRGPLCLDSGRHDLVLRRSTDLGVSWGPVITAVRGFVGHPAQRGEPSVSNPNPVEVALPLDATAMASHATRHGLHCSALGDVGGGCPTHAVLLHFETMNNPSASAHGLNMQAWSHDDGLTWGPPSLLAFPPHLNQGGLIGPSVGLQTPRAGYLGLPAGALIFQGSVPMDHSAPASANAAAGSPSPLNRVFLYVSTDQGVSWRASPSLVPGMSECSIAFRPPAGTRRGEAMEEEPPSAITMSCRTLQPRRAIIEWRAGSTDGTLIPSPTRYVDALVDPKCQGSLISSGASLYHSNANSSTHRTRLTIKQSTDGGASWSRGHLVHRGASGYSQLVGLGSSALGVLFEGGVLLPIEGIVFRAVKLPR